MTVWQLLHSLDSAELVEWQAFYKILNEEMQKDVKKPKQQGDTGTMMKGYFAGAKSEIKARRKR